MIAPTRYPQLYAVVPRQAPQPAHRESIPAARESRHKELRAKQAIDRASAVLDRLAARVAAFDQQITALEKRKAAALERAARLEEAILARMAAAQLSRAAGFHITFTARPAPPALEVLDASLIPRDYIRSKLVESVDKKAVKAAIARGEEIAGVRLMQKICLVRS